MFLGVVERGLGPAPTRILQGERPRGSSAGTDLRRMGQYLLKLIHDELAAAPHQRAGYLAPKLRSLSQQTD